MNKKLILAKTFDHLDFDQNFRKCRYGSNFSENLDFGKKKEKMKSWYRLQFSKNVNLGPNLWKIAMFVSIFENYLDFSKKKIENCDAGQFFLDNLNFGQNFRKSRFRSKVSKNLDFRQYCRKIKILVKISPRYDFGQNFRKISILVKIFENFDFGQNSWNARFVCKQSWFWPNFSNHRILSKIFVNYLDFCQNFRKSWF